VTPLAAPAWYWRRARPEETLGLRRVTQLLPYLQIDQLDYSWLARFVSLLVLPFADEDFAIILGGYIVVNQLMPVGLVALCIYVGMVASDFALYGVGVAARSAPWLKRLAVNDRVRSYADTLKRNVFEVVVLCRVVPGLEFVAFVACGWMRVPLARFTVASLVVSAFYLPLMLYLIVVFGDAMDDHVGLWTWPFLVVVVAITGFVRNRIFSFGNRAPATAAALSSRMRYSQVLFRSRLAGQMRAQSRMASVRSSRSASSALPR
jgi:membrane protein DedA with SNARE-associated domain